VRLEQGLLCSLVVVCICGDGRCWAVVVGDGGVNGGG
jgi:hypothetical protein